MYISSIYRCHSIIFLNDCIYVIISYTHLIHIQRTTYLMNLFIDTISDLFVGLSKGGILKRMDITSKDGQIKLKSVRIYLEDGTFRTLALQESATTREFSEISTSFHWDFAAYKPVDFYSDLTPSPYVGNVVHTMLKKLDLQEKDSYNWHLWEVKPDGKRGKLRGNFCSDCL